jgi:hypothetical protein
MSHGSDPWGGEKMSRSEAQRRYQNLIEYQLRPMIGNRSMTDDARIGVLKRMVREASRFKYESGAVAGSGAREEVSDLLKAYLRPDHWAGEELRDWAKRAIRAFGATLDDGE